MHPSGSMSLVGTTRTQPSFARIQQLLKNHPGTLNSLNWVDKFQFQYNPSRPIFNTTEVRIPTPTSKEDIVDQASLQSFSRLDLSPDAFIPDSKELADWEKSGSTVDINTILPATQPVISNGDDRFDIVTGMPVRDMMLDPVKQFRSFFDVFGSDDDRSDSDSESG